MEDVKKALAASISARAFGALLGFLALPVYIRLLGIEAYGVVGLFASLQVLVVFMDMGLAATLTRELASVGGSRAQLERGRDTALTFEGLYLGLTGLIALMLIAIAPTIAFHWIKLETLSADHVVFALQLAGVALACQWPANLYAAGLAGLHRQIPLAISFSAFTCLRVVFSLLALWYRPTLESFFLAQIMASLLQSLGMRVQLWRALEAPGHRAISDVQLVKQLLHFAGGMTFITITSIVLVQMDKVILSHLLRLPDFGVYVVASTLATGLYVLIGPMFSLIYPRFTACLRADDLQASSRLYHASSQAMAALVMPIAAVMAWFPAESLFVLTGDLALSNQGTWILVWLAAGSAINGLMNVPYAMQLAAGWTMLTIRTNIIAVLILAPLTWWLAKNFGAAGGALAWFVLNLGYLVLTPHLMHKRLLPGEKLRWYLASILVPAAACVTVVGTLWLVSHGSLTRWATALQLVICWVAATAATVVCLPGIRASVYGLLRGRR